MKTHTPQRKGDQNKLPTRVHLVYHKKTGGGAAGTMKVILREDRDPETDFYYAQQFRIYHDPYLIWDWETWRAVLETCAAYRIEVDAQCGGDAILEDRGRGTKCIVDFSILPEYQGKGVGREALELVKKLAGRLTAVTRKETLPFFTKCGFTMRRTIRNYYDFGVDGYAILWEETASSKRARLS
jgi:GNAT superfamily N-acetyltransferase